MRSTGKRSLALAGLLPGVLLACWAIPAGAQGAAESHPARGFAQAYDAKREIKIEGTVQQVVTKHTLGSPAGMHLLIATTGGSVDVHVGQFLAKDVRAALHAGLPVQVLGATENLHGKQFVLARELSFGGRTVTVRSRTGFLTNGTSSAKLNSPRAQKAMARINGGAQ